MTGVHIAFGFAKRNTQNLHIFDPGSQDEPKAPPQVIYCGPSNKAVDVVAGKFLEKKTSPFRFATIVSVILIKTINQNIFSPLHFIHNKIRVKKYH